MGESHPGDRAGKQGFGEIRGDRVSATESRVVAVPPNHAGGGAFFEDRRNAGKHERCIALGGGHGARQRIPKAGHTRDTELSAGVAGGRTHYEEEAIRSEHAEATACRINEVRTWTA